MDLNYNQEYALLLTSDTYIIDANSLEYILNKISINSLMIIFLGSCLLSILCSIKRETQKEYVAIAVQEPVEDLTKKPIV